MDKKEFANIDDLACGNIGSYTYISSGLYEEKKSKFYSYIFQIESDQQALQVITEAKKVFKDARHVVYAYIIGDTYKYSDDGEPSGTAGKMIYSLLEKQNIINTLVIVVRYFGGILLGAGPLSRAYLKSVKNAEENLKVIDYVPKKDITINTNYSNEDNLKKDISNTNSEIINVQYGENITYRIKVPEKDINLFNRYQKS